MTTDDDGNLMMRVMLIKVMITDDSEDGDHDMMVSTVLNVVMITYDSDNDGDR